MSRIEQSIDLEVPAHTAYLQWQRYQAFSAFIESTRREQDEDWYGRNGTRAVAWRAACGRSPALVDFRSVSPGRSRVTLRVDYQEACDAGPDVVKRRVGEELDGFRRFLEVRRADRAVARRLHVADVRSREHRLEEGRIGWILLWLLGVPIPVLILLYLIRGCT